MNNELPDHDEFLAAVDRVADVRFDQAAPVDVFNALARIRFAMNGGDPEELDEMGVEDTTLVVDLEDVVQGRRHRPRLRNTSSIC
jgi:hypothetical protein